MYKAPFEPLRNKCEFYSEKDIVDFYLSWNVEKDASLRSVKNVFLSIRNVICTCLQDLCELMRICSCFFEDILEIL